MSIKPTVIATTVFYVLPVDSDGDGLTPSGVEQLQPCKYYVYDPDEQTYLSWNSALLPASPSGLPGSLDFVVIQQLPPDAPIAPALAPNSGPTPNATLYSATVRTASPAAGVVTQLPSVYLATVPEDRADALVVIPVSKTATREVILVFAVKDAKGNTVLRSTFDPEIKGSTN
jgi:hypothetical protein